MKQKKLSLHLRCKTDKGWVRYPVAYGKNGKVRPGYVIISGQPVFKGDGTYAIRGEKDGKRGWIPAGTSASEALATMNRMLLQRAARAGATDAGLEVLPVPEEQRTLKQAALALAEDKTRAGHSEAAEMTKRFTAELFEVLRQPYSFQVTRDDLYRYLSHLQAIGNSPRTVANKYQRMRSFLLSQGVPAAIFPPRPSYERKLPTIYEPAQASLVIEACDDRLKLALTLAWQCGLREQELMHLEFSDIDQHARVLRVQGKPMWGYKVKDAEQREVPIPDKLFDMLVARHKAQPRMRLLLGRAGDKPDGHLLRRLKRTARDAGLNCGRCAGCLSEATECSHYTLHEFRRSYLTTLLRIGIDLKTVQAFAGHADLASTTRYLRPAGAAATQAKINSIVWGS